MRGFSKPMTYDPTLADRPTPVRNRRTETLQARDLGFEEPDAEIDEKSREALEQNEKLRAKVAELQGAVDGARDSESLSSRKLQSFQQVNRSQNTLMRAELSKCRRKLTHTQQVCLRLREQVEWLMAHSPVLNLPPELHGLPKEEDCTDEAADLAQHHQRWEHDVAQLATLIKAELTTGDGTGAILGTSAGKHGNRIAELEQKVEMQEREIEKLHQEARQRDQGGTSPAILPPVPQSQDVTTLQKQLETKKEESKEHVKKLKQLATAYKQLEQAKKELEDKLSSKEDSLELARKDAAARPQVLQRAAVSPVLANRVTSLVKSEKAKIAELRTAVIKDFQNIPAMLQQAIEQKMPDLMETASKDWKAKYLLECDRRRKLHNLVQELRGNIRVYARVRPLNERERASCLNFPSPNEVTINNADLGVKKTWEFNQVFTETSTQVEVFKDVRDLVASMLDGYNVCIFAYGQTGSGKTHSMQGYGNDPGIYQRTFLELFKVIDDRRETVTTELRASITEIYNEEIRDLLSTEKKRLQIKQSKEEGIHVPGLTKQVVQRAEDVEDLLTQGQKNRSVACTDMNTHSSRSHLVVQIYANTKTTAGKQTHSCITLVDLAGSERLAKSGVTGDRAKEAISINKSLSALGDVINARATKSSHTPFRNSTLTHLLQESLSGDSKTLMLLQLNPCSDYLDETMCSLQFGARVNNVEMKK